MHKKWRGEVYSLSRWLGVKSKLLKERLGAPHDLQFAEAQTKRQEQDALTHRQLDERHALQERLDHLREGREADINQLREMIFSRLPDEKIRQFQKTFEQPEHQYNHDYDMGM